MLIFEQNDLHGYNINFSLIILSGKFYHISCCFMLFPPFIQVGPYVISTDSEEDGKSSTQKSLEILLKDSYTMYIDNIQNMQNVYVMNPNNN